MLKITKKGTKAWVTFSIIPMSESEVFLCGDWNDWKNETMKVKKNGEHYLTKVLKIGDSYQFGYKIDNVWSCDDETESIESPFGSKNSLLRL
jgi:1,4-alpha-glucan branching enzyme